ncbi:DapH/DapD/GlmU-related protein [Pseudomonas plecoglossicida]|uniref:DapH/DapD/GlmU-related protein n=1 Tax=Pseudomonas plecoglossicida TaxID=70775 RepID=UPI0015E27BFA|nr:DapH/DapD/GlmU-related protein [Pseudomonas plecoglossicida]MBA1321431.1 hypothetical protein [Pseudomonas plecoglossicida]
MFNTAKVSLSAFDSTFISIARDCDFYCVAKIPTLTRHKLVPLSNIKYLKEIELHRDSIAGVICPPDLADKIPPELGCALSENPVRDAYSIHGSLTQTRDHYWTTFESQVHESVIVHPTAYISPTNVIIEKGCKIGPNVTIMDKVIIGQGTSVGANSVIGTDAYEMTSVEGKPTLIDQAGGVKIGKGCVILSGVTISRSTFPTWTKIGDYCSFDNLVHIAHDCQLGNRVKMTACSMLSGRALIGDDVYIGPNATISNGIHIGERSTVSIGSVVVFDTPSDTRVTGNFAMEHKSFMRNLVKNKRT